MRQENRIRVDTVFLKNLIVAVSYNPLQSLIKRTLMLNLSVTVDKNEIVIFSFQGTREVICLTLYNSKKSSHN